MIPPNFSLMAIPLQCGNCIARNLLSGSRHTNSTKLKQDHLKLGRDIQHDNIRRMVQTPLFTQPDAVLFCPELPCGTEARIPRLTACIRVHPWDLPWTGRAAYPDSLPLRTGKHRVRRPAFHRAGHAPEGCDHLRAPCGFG